MKTIKQVQKWLYATVKKQKLKEKLTFAMTANPFSNYKPSKFSDAEIEQMEQQYQQLKTKAFWA